ncbi:SDR family NAD(P)-dependent oxidoreductase [Sporofaciens sp. JLR.KK001]|jgi:3-oxoacyl-[acyl-carrier protein] reductase|uniref:SDR family NAD(P)-dependent oxidoreductase n=1 Tax=Sporofaciens sp. JLR.KK001 TaxID=3112621 RepID=UPI002FEE799A
MILENKNAIITGARRGIGRAAVEVFASQGANIWACARRQDDIFEEDVKFLSKKYRVQIFPLYFDVTNEAEMKAAIQDIRKQKVNIDILVNAAGIADNSTRFQMTSIDKMKHVMNVNLFSVTLITQYVSRLMIRQNSGCIVNIASIAGIDGAPAQYEYAVSKAAIIGATRNLARELAPNNIRVNAIAPGMTETDMGAQIEDTLKQEILGKVIMKRMGKPEEIANVIAFAASDMSSYMTGQVLRVDGGM